MYKDILLPIDLNNVETQEKAVQTAIELAKSFGARLHVMTIVPDFGVGVVSTFFPDDYEEKAVAAADAALHDFVNQRLPGDIKVQHIVAHGTIYEEILAFAGKTKVDLILMASHRPELSDYLIGPNASKVVRHAECSVLVVRG
jgi:nucleotide-binding universal stress UspA family protein